MTEHAKSFVNNRTASVSDAVKLDFFNALQDMALQSTGRLEMIDLSLLTREKLIPGGYEIEEPIKMLLADLILIGINKNEQNVKARSQKNPSSTSAANNAPDV
jgi:hypothetical protein